MKKEKWYFIYMKRSGLTPTLYAITDKKKLKDSFLSERNPNLFVCKKKLLDSNEVINVKSSLGQRMLYDREFETSDDEGIHKVHLVVTEKEDIDSYTHDNKALEILGRNTNPELMCANDSITNALHTLLYYHVMSFVTGNDDPFLDGVSALPPKFFDSGYKIDRLGIFLMMYGDTMKK